MYNILLISSIFGFVLTTLLFLKKSTNTQATFFLGIFYFLLSVYALQAYIVDGGQLYKFTWFFLWPLAPYNLIAVPIYFYFQTIMEDRFKWKWGHLVLFVPFVLAILDAGYIYLQPSSVYEGILNNAITDPKNRLRADYWLLSLNDHLLMRHVWQFGALLVLLPKLSDFVKKGDSDKPKITLNRWLMSFWSILTLMSIAAILYAIQKRMRTPVFDIFSDLKDNISIVTVLLYLIIFALGIVPVYFPTILYGYPRSRKRIAGSDRNSVGASDEKLTDALDEQQSSNSDTVQESDLKFGLTEMEIKKKLELLLENKSYLDRDFNVTNCARELEMPAHHLSYFLNQYYGLSFSAYKNKLRMEHAKSLIQNGFLADNTMEALAWECGFASRSSFSKIFKGSTGVSPSVYVLRTQKNK